MNTQSNAKPESPLESPVVAPAVIPWTRRMYWSMRRELWEYRSIYMAPLAVAAVFLLVFLTAFAINPAHRREPPGMPYELAAGVARAGRVLTGPLCARAPRAGAAAWCRAPDCL